MLYEHINWGYRRLSYSHDLVPNLLDQMFKKKDKITDLKHFIIIFNHSYGCNSRVHLVKHGYLINCTL